MFVVLDTTKGADAASEGALEDADFATYVVEGFAVGDEGDVIDGLADGFQELGHFGIGDDYDAAGFALLHVGHVDTECGAGNESRKAEVLAVGSRVLEVGELFFCRANEDKVFEYRLSDLLYFACNGFDLFFHGKIMLNAKFLKSAVDLEELVIGYTHWEPMHDLVIGAMRWDRGGMLGRGQNFFGVSVCVCVCHVVFSR